VSPLRTPSVRRVLDAAGSAAAVAAVAAPLALVLGAFALRRQPPGDALRLWSVRAWGAALAILVVLAAARALRERAAARAALLLGGAAALLHGAAVWAFRLDATFAAGVGEVSPPVERREVGPLARLPEVLLQALAPGAGAARLLVGGRELSAPLGPATAAGALTEVTVEGPFPAPSFEVVGEHNLDPTAGLLKIDPAKRDFFIVGFLPHRFYLSLPEGAAAADPRSPARLHLRIQRGKIRVLERDVAAEERVEFERLTFAYGAGDVWARIRVRRRLPAWPGVAIALAAVLAAGGIALRGRRRAG